MKILYLAVHRHKGWGAEHWLSRAFERKDCEVYRYDYRQKRRQFLPWWLIKRELVQLQKEFKPDVVLLQRAEKMPASVVEHFGAPVVFWSTEQLIRRRDVDQLLQAKRIFNWVYVHTYTCTEYVQTNFPHLISQTSVMHNATGVETLSDNKERPRLAIFNRNLSARRREWLLACDGLVDIIEGRFGDGYFEDLSQTKIALNIHFSGESLDDFETGIYEALASGCVVVTERLNPRTVNDLKMHDAVVEVDTPEQMRAAIEALAADPQRLAALAIEGRKAINANLWDARADQMLEKFEAVIQDKQ